jgi:adenylate kinase
MEPGISRPPRAGSAGREGLELRLLRRWFWSRKPDAGFVLADFPATLLQALVLDEWLEARNEQLDAVFGSEPHPCASHYRSLGLLVPMSGSAPPE